MRAQQYQWVILQAGLVLATGCAAQVDGDYPGPSLGSVAGTVDLDGAQAADGDTAIALVWDLLNPRAHDLDLPFGEFVSVTPASPASVRLNIVQPPAPELLVEVVDGNALAVAKVLWVDVPTFAPRPGGGYSGHGTALSHALVYVRDDVAVGSETARFLHSTPRAGYHIYEVYQPEGVYPCESAFWIEDGCDHVTSTCVRDVLLPTPDDLDTPVVITATGGKDDFFLYEDLAKVCVP